MELALFESPATSAPRLAAISELAAAGREQLRSVMCSMTNCLAKKV